MRISAKDSPAAPTVSCCWWSRVSCCRLSRCACSLASAGNVCWAKPNHGFFHCQQPVAIFFRDCRRSVRIHACRSASRASCARIGCKRNDDASMRCMQAVARLAACTHAMRHALERCRSMRATRMCTQRENARRGNSGGNPQPPISRRTSPFARKLRGLFCAPRTRRCSARAFSAAGKRRTRDVAVAGSRCSMATRLSGLRLPAARRTRPGRGGR